MRTDKGTTHEPKASRNTHNTVRVMRDMRDGRLDYFLPRAEAFALYNAGELYFECTNGCYHVKDKD